MPWPFTRRRRPPPANVTIDGERFDLLADIPRGILALGGIGSGKTFSTEGILRQLIRHRCPLLVGVVKPDEFARYERLCREEKALHRLVRVCPGSKYRINLASYLVIMKGGGARVAAQTFGRLAEVLARSEGGGNNEQLFWKALFEETLRSSIQLVELSGVTVTLPAIYQCIMTLPKSPKEFVSDAFAKRPGCGLSLSLAKANRKPESDQTYKQVVDFFVRVASIGIKARSAAQQMATSVLSGLIAEPFHDGLCLSDSTLTPEQIEREKLIVVLDYPLMRFGVPARMFNTTWVMLAQMYCMGRDAHGRDAPFTIVRDEAGWLVHPDWDAQVQVVGRSQKLAHFDIVQDLDILISCFGGGEKARHEASAFASNHMIKFFFQNASTETNEWASKLIGDRKEILVSGGGGGAAPQPGGDLIDDFLGVRTGAFHWSEQYQRMLRPEFFASLPVGVAVAHVNGAHRVIDFRTRRRS